MAFLPICQKIIEGIKSRISSPDYLAQFKEERHFVRKRKLTMDKVLSFLFFSSKQPMSLNIAAIREELPSVEFPDVTKQAVSKARMGIRTEFFRDQFHFSAETFYKALPERKSWKGYFPFAIDGSRIQVPTTDDNISYFGLCRNGSHSREDSMASISVLYDILHDIVVDGVLHEFKHNERSSAAEHLDYLEAQGLEKNAIIVCDRGYPGYELYRRINEKGYFFLMRIQKKVHSLTDGPSDDEIKDYVPSYIKDGKPVRVRVMHFILEGGEEEWLVTNLLDPSLTPQDFKELYYRRWKVEGKYHEFKSQLELEEFIGAHHKSVNQEFYLCLLHSNICSLLKADADALIEKETACKKNKYKYQADRAFLIGRVKKWLVRLLFEEEDIAGKLEEIVKEASKRRSQIQPNRKCKRPKMQLRFRHLKNRKTCV